MNIDRAVLALAGTFTLTGAALAAFVSPWWLLLVAFVGVNQLQASITRWCPAALIFGRLGLSAGCAFTPAASDDVTDGTRGGTEVPGASGLQVVD